jgi:hypothetical protein
MIETIKSSEEISDYINYLGRFRDKYPALSNGDGFNKLYQEFVIKRVKSSRQELKGQHADVVFERRISDLKCLF